MSRGASTYPLSPCLPIMENCSCQQEKSRSRIAELLIMKWSLFSGIVCGLLWLIDCVYKLHADCNLNHYHTTAGLLWLTKTIFCFWFPDLVLLERTQISILQIPQKRKSDNSATLVVKFYPCHRWNKEQTIYPIHFSCFPQRTISRPGHPVCGRRTLDGAIPLRCQQDSPFSSTGCWTLSLWIWTSSQWDSSWLVSHAKVM